MDHHAVERARAIDTWFARVNAFNREGVALTQTLSEYLSTPTAIDALLRELDRLRDETRNGRFDVHNALQREIEFKRFSGEYRHRSGKVKSFEEEYELFNSLEVLPESFAVDLKPSEAQMLSVKRAAFEAVGFLEFLREFKAGTRRPMLVVGNDKAQLAGGGYGRQWVVEPLEDLLERDFELMYNRVPSHGSMRLTTPPAFEGQRVKDLNRRMPHLVIVDGASPGKADGIVRFSKAIRGYANWLAAFNRLRAGGDEDKYMPLSLLPPSHLREITHWHEFTSVTEQMQRWVDRGEMYDVRLWSPHSTEMALMGDIFVPWPSRDISGDRPLAILANPIIYMPEMLPAGTVPDYVVRSRPYALDSADRDLLKMLAPNGVAADMAWGDFDDNATGPVGSINPSLTRFGFGRFGFERRSYGPSMNAFFAVLQGEVRRRIHEMA